MMVNVKYRCSDSQRGFRQGTGTKTAFLRHFGNVVAMKLGAVLDLRSAYDTVGRKKLPRVMKKELRNNTLHIVEAIL